LINHRGRRKRAHDRHGESIHGERGVRAIDRPHAAFGSSDIVTVHQRLAEQMADEDAKGISIPRTSHGAVALSSAPAIDSMNSAAAASIRSATVWQSRSDSRVTVALVKTSSSLIPRSGDATRCAASAGINSQALARCTATSPALHTPIA
jgi:hypothetical protein